MTETWVCSECGKSFSDEPAFAMGDYKRCSECDFEAEAGFDMRENQESHGG